MNNDDLEKRVARLQDRLNSEQPSRPGAPMRCVVVHGGLPPGEPLYAMAGVNEWLRESGEELDAFADRAKAAACELREPLLIIGGLPNTQAQHDAAMAAYDAWLLTDDGVPPCEPGRGIPA